ncbi:MAG TPA: hypothetical protein VNV86_00030, partial [Candidatus Acidoferrum sp.]|nr:hypothetical protein [Candidatus Acidoferrum sp.]
PQGMLSSNLISRVVKRTVLVWLSLLLGLGSLMPIAAAALADSCCPTTKAHACCRRHHAGEGPAFTTNPCMQSCACAGMTQGSAQSAGVRPLAGGPPAWAHVAPVVPAQVQASSTSLPHNLRQRPPPART